MKNTTLRVAVAALAVCGLTAGSAVAAKAKPKPKPKPVADVAVVAHTPSSLIASIGVPMSYEVVVTSNGPEIPGSITVRDRLPAMVGFVSVSGSAGAKCTGPRVGQSGTVTCSWAKPTAGARYGMTVVGVPNVATLLTNTVRVSTSGRDPISTNNLSVTSITAVPYAVAQGGQRCTIVGTNGNDVIDGTPGDDVICGLGGNDVIRGLDGNDVIDGGSANDLLVGGNGNDRIYGGTGQNRLFGGSGNDILVGGPGRDFSWGGTGTDVAKITTGDRLLSVERRVR